MAPGAPSTRPPLLRRVLRLLDIEAVTRGYVIHVFGGASDRGWREEGRARFAKTRLRGHRQQIHTIPFQTHHPVPSQSPARARATHTHCRSTHRVGTTPRHTKLWGRLRSPRRSPVATQILLLRGAEFLLNRPRVADDGSARDVLHVVYVVGARASARHAVLGIIARHPALSA